MSGREGYEIDGVRVAQARMALNQDGAPRGPEEKPMTQGDLAAAVGLGRVRVNQIESGNARVSLETLEGLAAVLGCSREWLLGEPEPVDELELAREKMASALSEFSDAVDLLQRRIRQEADTTAAVKA